MKILVLGGAGDMGREAVRDLVLHDDVEKIIIGDYRASVAEDFRSTLIARDKAEVRFVDANNPEQLRQVIAAYDVVLNCIGPFYQYERKVAEAALEAGRSYISLCDDYDAAEEVLVLDEKAKSRGLTMVTGLGWTPGITSLLTKKAASEMERVERIRLAWAGSADDSEGLAVIKHTLHIFTGEITAFQNSRFTKLAAGTEKERVVFPAPIGEATVYHVGHPEPVTMPRYFTGVQEVSLKGGLCPAWLNTLAKVFVGIKLTNTPKKRDVLAKICLGLSPVFGIGGAGFSGTRVDVYGRKDGQPVKISYGCTDKMRRLTGIPAAIGTLTVGRGQVKEKGVMAPERAFEVEPFLNALAQREIKIEKMS